MKKSFSTRALLYLTLITISISILFTGCGNKKKEIVIYTSSEDFKMEYLEKRMEEQFPNYDIIFEFKSSGDHAAILKAAGKNAECHITHNLEYGYIKELEELGYLANLEGKIDFSAYTDDAAVSTYYVPEERNGGSIIINMDVIEERGLDIPTSYEDLLSPQYKGLISMPSPTSSGTGYMFLLSLVNEWGEDKAFEYFDKLSENILSFTTSGSGPVNALVTKEVAIGLGMTGTAVTKINEGANLKILYFEEGSPYSLYGQGVIAGNENDEAVMEVFQFLATTLTEEKCENFFPEKIYKDKDFTVENYPTGIIYSDMSENTPERKEELLKKWKY